MMPRLNNAQWLSMPFVWTSPVNVLAAAVGYGNVVYHALVTGVFVSVNEGSLGGVVSNKP